VDNKGAGSTDQPLFSFSARETTVVDYLSRSRVVFDESVNFVHACFGRDRRSPFTVDELHSGVGTVFSRTRYFPDSTNIYESDEVEVFERLTMIPKRQPVRHNTPPERSEAEQ
jgi:hypothetical protein